MVFKLGQGARFGSLGDACLRSPNGSGRLLNSVQLSRATSSSNVFIMAMIQRVRREVTPVAS